MVLQGYNLGLPYRCHMGDIRNLRELACLLSYLSFVSRSHHKSFSHLLLVIRVPTPAPRDGTCLHMMPMDLSNLKPVDIATLVAHAIDLA